MSAQFEGETPRGEAPQAHHTAESYIAGIGASGAVLAAAVVAFVLLVGIVSFDGYPRSDSGGSSPPVELSTPRGAAEATAPAIGDADSTLLASVGVLGGPLGGGGAPGSPELGGGVNGQGSPAPAPGETPGGGPPEGEGDSGIAGEDPGNGDDPAGNGNGNAFGQGNGNGNANGNGTAAGPPPGVGSVRGDDSGSSGAKGSGRPSKSGKPGRGRGQDDDDQITPSESQPGSQGKKGGRGKWDR